jgi:hypothetical protein
LGPAMLEQYRRSYMLHLFIYFKCFYVDLFFIAVIIVDTGI